MRICLLCEGVSATEAERCASCGLRLVPVQQLHFPVRRGEEDAGNPWLRHVVDGKYRITSVLGKGGMGAVFRAEHEVSLVPVALKILHPRWALRAAHREYFLLEARKAGRVVHEHTARILDVGEDGDGTVYIAMELVEGATLADWIAGNAKLAPADVVDILLQISSALVAAHAAGLVHRDLTPRNVMVAVRHGRPFVKVLDFGIAKGMPLQLQAAGQEIAGGGPVGFASPPYSAPEHLRGHDVDGRADLYSLGVIAFEIMTRELPAVGRTTRELAAATLDGRLQPLQPPPGMPRRLVKLVRRLLQHDPNQRPGSAEEVVRELQRIRDPKHAALQKLAIFGLLVSLPAFALAHGRERLPYAETVPGSRLMFAKEPLGSHVKATELRRAEIKTIRLSSGERDPGALELVGYLEGKRIGSVHPTRSEPDGLQFSIADPAYDNWLDIVASKAGPVDLGLVAVGGQTLGYARVLLDDQPPQVQLTVEDSSTTPLVSSSRAPGDVLRGQDLVSVEITDHGTLVRCEMTVSWAEGEERKTSAPLSIDRRYHAPASELLGGVFPGVASRASVHLHVQAMDGAGNVGQATLEFKQVDLAAPRVLRARGYIRDELLTFGGNGARVRLEMDESEGDLVLVFEGPDGKRHEQPLDSVGQQIEVTLAPLTQDPKRPFGDGEYAFTLRDAAGNADRKLRVKFEARAEELAARLDVDEAATTAAGGAATVLDDAQGPLIVTNGKPVVLNLSCNSLYQPRQLILHRLGGETARAASLLRQEFGIAVLQLPILDDGEYRLGVGLVDPGGNTARAEYDVRALPSLVQLRLPNAAGKRYLRELVDLDLLQVDESRLREGSAWALVPNDPRLIRGRLWYGEPAASFEVRPPEQGGVLGLDWPLRRGMNLLALQLQDVLHRPIEVRAGEQQAAEVAVAPGVEASLIARFAYYSEPFAVARAPVDVEREQSVKITLQSLVPWQPDDVLTMRLDNAVLPLVIDTHGNLHATAAYEVVAKAAGLIDHPGQDPHGRSATMLAQITTPAGEHPLELQIRTIRSTLHSVKLGDIATRQLSPVLAEIMFVPVLAPDEVLRDPVAPNLVRRQEFRVEQPADVRNLKDLFLQQGELTRAQVDALVRDFAGLSAADRGVWQGLVHTFDPLGSARLENLRPGGSSESWRQALASDPSRPVTGINFFQAYALTRIAGLLATGERELFRLPSGAELELAALGAGRPRIAGGLNGFSRGTHRLTLTHFRDAASWPQDLALWPPRLADSLAYGDSVFNWQEVPIVALDFGVREWVLDLPPVPGDGREVLREWLADHEKLLERAESLAIGAMLPDSLRADVTRLGVVRGLATGEVHGLFDALTGEVPDGDNPLPSSVPGVVRTLVLRRDGEGVAGQPDPHLRYIGMRLAGGLAFVREARK